VKRVTDGDDSDLVKAKLEAIGFGFLIPVFFVVSGITFDLHVFLHHPAELWRVPFFLVLMLVARGVPVFLLYRKVLTRQQMAPMALFSATGLPLIVVITSIALSEGRILEVNAAALVAAGLLSVTIFPAGGIVLLRRIRGGPTAAATPADT
jgi:Kef-type K+ transport system membrane component KefB